LEISSTQNTIVKYYQVVPGTPTLGIP